MDLKALLAKIRRIEIRSRHSSDQITSGDYHTSFKGKGMSFSEVREYQYGDDVRHIDWNVTARSGKPHLKVYEEERELSIYFIVDISPSVATALQPRNEKIAEIMAMLAFAALKNNDLTGMLLFGYKVEHFVRLQKGRNHILNMIRQLLDIEPSPGGTKLSVALDHIMHHAKHRSIVFILSDFLFSGYEESLARIAKKNDVIGIAIQDYYDIQIPNIGIVTSQDSETGIINWIDTSDVSYNKERTAQYYKDLAYMDFAFKKAKANLIVIKDGDDYVKKLRTFFKSRK